MKYKKYIVRIGQHPWLTGAVRFSLARFNGGNDCLKEVVRTKVGYIAPRPYEKLDLNAKNSSSSQPLSSKYRFVAMEMWTSVDYSIHFVVSGDGHERIAFLDGGKTVGQRLDEIKAWFLKCDAFEGQSLIISGIIKQNRSGSSHSGLTNVNFEFYEPPVGERAIHRPNAIRDLLPRLTQYELEARRAYMAGEPLPPLIPGS